MKQHGKKKRSPYTLAAFQACLILFVVSINAFYFVTMHKTSTSTNPVSKSTSGTVVVNVSAATAANATMKITKITSETGGEPNVYGANAKVADLDEPEISVEYRRNQMQRMPSIDGGKVLVDLTGIASQYAEVNWVMGIQKRRKAGLEPGAEDPYADIPEVQLQPTFRHGGVRARGSSGGSVALELAAAPSLGGGGGSFPSAFARDDAALASFAFSWPRGSATTEMHFVHVPKCGGTSVTKVLRRMACAKNNGTEDTLDCCLRPGFCGAPEHRMCRMIMGCINHLPKMRQSFLPAKRPSLTILRSSLSRVVSSWHYRCHNPNFDCFKLLPTLRTWKMHLAWVDKGKMTPPGVKNYTFNEFLEIPMYHNIATRMFAWDVMPYGGKVGGAQAKPEDPVSIGVALGKADLKKASALLQQFAWVGLMELMGTSMVLLSAKLGQPLERSDFLRMRSSHSSAYEGFVRTLRPARHDGAVKASVAGTLAHSESRTRRILAVNALDESLWAENRARQCRDLASLGLLAHPVVLRDLELSGLPPCPADWSADQGA